MAGQSFKFWTSYLTALDRMDDATAGRLVKALARCVFEGEQPDFADAPHLWPTFDVMLEQAKTSCELSEKARERGRKGGQARRKNADASSAQAPLKQCSSEMKREEMKGNEISSLSERKAARAAAAAPGGATSAAPDEFPQPAVPPKQHIARPAGE